MMLAPRLRAEVEGIVTAAGLTPVVRLARAALRSMSPRHRRLVRSHRARFERFRSRYASVIGPPPPGTGERGAAILMASGFPPAIELEIALVKGLQHAGYEVVVLHLGGRSGFVEPYYRLAGVSRFFSWKSFKRPPDHRAAERLLADCRTVEDVVAAERDGIRIGRFAFATALRRLYRGSLDPSVPSDRRGLLHHVAEALGAADGAGPVLDAVAPSLMVFNDTEYTPQAALFDACLVRGVDVIQYDVAHRDGALMLQRYTLETRTRHPWSLSDRSWEDVRTMPWTEREREDVREELHGTYASGEWFSACGTQFDTRLVDEEEIRRRLGLDPSRKAAVVFSHILWDAPLSWGYCLFPDYEAWLVETVRAACANPRLDWLVKIHPANLGKSWIERIREEPAEVRAIRERVGELPPHVRLIPADTSISTFSLLGVTDYCVTVRGTVGIEAARLGIPVVNAGGGRYDHRGFTMDPPTREAYTGLLGRLESLPPLDEEQRELADRFAWGYLLARPLRLSAVGFRHSSAGRADGERLIETRGEIRIRDPGEWGDSPDIRAFAAWVRDGGRTDFFLPPAAVAG